MTTTVISNADFQSEAKWGFNESLNLQVLGLTVCLQYGIFAISSCSLPTHNVFLSLLFLL